MSEAPTNVNVAKQKKRSDSAMLVEAKMVLLQSAERLSNPNAILNLTLQLPVWALWTLKSMRPIKIVKVSAYDPITNFLPCTLSLRENYRDVFKGRKFVMNELL